MAEVIAAGPALIAVIQISDRIIGLCKNYIETVQDYPSDLRTILVDISFLKTALENLDILTSYTGSTSDQSQGSHKLKDPIEECLRLVQQLETLFPSNIQQSSINTSKRQKMKASFAQLAWPLKESKARKLLDQIRPLKETFILELTSQSYQDLREIKTQTSKTQEVVTESRRQEIYSWLQHTDPSSLYYKAQQDYEAETGNWLSRSPEWLDWIQSKTRCLWIHGIPGAGKTVLLSHMINTLQEYCNTREADNFVCVYYFCFYGHEQDEGKPFLRWLINQLCRRKRLIPPSVLTMFNYGGEPSLADLLKALGEILLEFKTAYVVVDALDESLPRDEMLEVVEQIVKDTRFRNLKLLASSREYPDIEKTMEASSTPISMDNDYVAADIRTYVHSSIRSNEKFKRFPADLLSEIEDAVSKGAKGMFRWAVCQLDILPRLKCESAFLRRALKDLPKSLRETYDRLLLMLSEEERFVVRCLFEWMRLHSRLYESGIPCQTLVQVAERCTSERNGMQSGYFHDKSSIKELCGCWIREEVFHEGLAFETVAISFAHYTVREYIDSGGLSRVSAGELATPERLLMQQPLQVAFEEAHRLHLNTAGLHKMASPDYNCLVEVIYTDFNIFCTVTALEALRVMAREIAKQEHLFHLAVGLFDPSGACFGSLCALCQREPSFVRFAPQIYEPPGPFWSIEFLGPGNPRAMQFLYLLTWVKCLKLTFPLIKRFVEMFGIRQLTQEQLRFKVEVDLDVSREVEPVIDGSILEAAAQGAIDTQEGFLFPQLVDLSWGTLNPSKVLLSYIGGNNTGNLDHGTSIQQLLQHGADPNGLDQRVTLLQMAVYNTDYTAVKILLEAKADPNISGTGVKRPWEEKSIMKNYNRLFGASPLYICRHYKAFQISIPLDEDIEPLLVEHGAKSFLRPESAHVLQTDPSRPYWDNLKTCWRY